MRNIVRSTFFFGVDRQRFAGPSFLLVGPANVDQALFSLVCLVGGKRIAVYYLKYIDYQEGNSQGLITSVYRVTGNTASVGAAGQKKDTLETAVTGNARSFFGPGTLVRGAHPLVIMGSREVNSAGATRVSEWRAYDEADAIILTPGDSLAFYNTLVADQDARVTVNIHWAELP